MTQELHRRHVVGSVDNMPENMQPWSILKDTYEESNIEQVKYTIEILKAGGSEVRQVEDPPN